MEQTVADFIQLEVNAQIQEENSPEFLTKISQASTASATKERDIRSLFETRRIVKQLLLEEIEEFMVYDQLSEVDETILAQLQTTLHANAVTLDELNGMKEQINLLRTEHFNSIARAQPQSTLYEEYTYDYDDI